MEKWGLGPKELAAENPALVYARISGYGQTGPYASRPGFASVCEGIGGLRYVNGFPGEAPVRPNLSLGDSLAGLHAAFGVVLALLEQRSSGNNGQVVDVAIYESIFNMLEAVVPEFDGAGVVPGTFGFNLDGHCANEHLSMRRWQIHRHRRQRRLHLSKTHGRYWA